MRETILMLKCAGVALAVIGLSFTAVHTWLLSTIAWAAAYLCATTASILSDVFTVR